MSDNNNNGNNGSNTSGGNQSQGSQTQGTQSTGREFIQTDTSSSAYMQKGDDSKPLTTKETK